MHGFTQSYNISVCCAIVLSKIVSLLKTQNKFVPLADKDKKELRLDWYRKSIKNSKTIIKNLTK
jgi:tRNA (guanosine-2'-O-)-methyltransferase